MPLLEIAAEEAKYEDLERVVVGSDAEKFFQVGARLPPQEKEELVEFLKGNMTCLHGTPVTPQGSTQISSATTSMSTPPLPPRSSHSGAHPGSMPKKLEKR